MCANTAALTFSSTWFLSRRRSSSCSRDVCVFKTGEDGGGASCSSSSSFFPDEFAAAYEYAAYVAYDTATTESDPNATKEDVETELQVFFTRL